MVMWRRGCEACHADAEPLAERHHEYVHELLQRAESAEGGEFVGRAALEERIENLRDELHDARCERDAYLDELEDLKAKGTKA